MSELSDESKALIEADAPFDEATPFEIDAMHARVMAALGGLPAPVTPPDAAPLVAKGAVGATSIKVVGAAVAAALGSGALLFALNEAAPPKVAPPRPSASVQLTTTPSRPEPAPIATTSQAAPSAPAASVASAARPPPALRPSNLTPPTSSVAAAAASEEALLVATAEAQLRSGHAGAALALYERHLREYPKGALRQESFSGRIVALCGVGRVAEARAEVTRFGERHPGSPALLRMQRACGIQP